MAEVLTWALSAGLLLILFVVFLLAGIYRKSLGTVIFSVVLFLGFMVAGAVAVYQFTGKSYNALKLAATPKSGQDIYEEEFGAPGSDCVQLFGSATPAIAVVREPTFLCFKSCPAEVSRILSLHDYEVVERAAADVMPAANKACCRGYFSTERFGMMVLECMAAASGHTYTAYVSKDSTHVYYMSMPE